jgi:Ca2+-binding RTX toxin-like protein
MSAHSHRPRQAVALAAVLGAALALPSAASAATVSMNGTTLVYAAAAGEVNTPSVAPRHGTTNQFDVYDFKSNLVPGADCVESDNQFSRPHHVICTATGLAAISATLGDRDDSYTGYSALDDTIETNLDLGAGNDSVNDQSGGISNVVAGDGIDDVETYGGEDFIDGGAGNDDLGGGDDDDEIHGGANPSDNETLWGGGGDDTLYGDAGPDAIYGMDGDDTILGGIGNDDLRGNDGKDDLSGEAGDDEMQDDYPMSSGPTAGDVLRGGTGRDTADYASRYAHQGSTLAITLDGVANDGQDDDQNGTAEEGDNVGPDGDVEVVLSGSGDDYLEGSDRAELLDGGGGDDGIAGLEGDDKLHAGVGEDVVLGGGGNDEIDGSSNKDKLLGEGGNDEIDGGSGDDQIDLGTGTDSVDAGYDNDVVLARDGEVDQIACGIGGDVADIDFQDVVNADPGSWCETVRSTVAPTTGAANGDGATAPANGTPAPAPTAPVVARPGGLPTGNANAAQVIAIAAAPGSRLSSIVKSGVMRVSATVPGSGSLVTVASVDARTAKKLAIASAKWVRIGAGRANAAAAGKVTVKVRLTRRAKKRLKRATKVKVRLVSTFTGTDGTKWTTTKTVAVKR